MTGGSPVWNIFTHFYFRVSFSNSSSAQTCESTCIRFNGPPERIVLSFCFTLPQALIEHLIRLKELEINQIWIVNEREGFSEF